MHVINKLLTLLLLGVMLFCITLLSAQALEGRVSYPSMMAEEQKAKYDKLIAEMQIEEKNREFFEESYRRHIGDFEKITFGMDEYVLEYSLGGHFSGMEGDVEKAFFEKLGTGVRIYVPVYAQTGSSRRMIGHVVLEKKTNEYSDHPVFSKGVSDGTYVHFLDRAGTLDAVKAKCAEHGLTDVTDVILVNLRDEWRDAAARIAVAQTPSGCYVLDYGNAAYVEGIESAVYTFEEFAKIYGAYEKTRFPIELAEDVSEIAESVIEATEWIIIVVLIATGIAVIIGVSYSLRRKKQD